MNIIKLHATDSTNTYLKEMARNIAIPDETVVITENQQKGRGQRGNGWFSTPEGSLTFSIFKEFDVLPVRDHFKISMAVSLAIIEVLENIKVIRAMIKWPNDILSGNKKLAGILVENSLVNERIKFTVIGIGLNVGIGHFPDLPRAISVSECTEEPVNREELFDVIFKTCVRYLQKLNTTTFDVLQQEYERHLFHINEVSLFENARTMERFQGIIRGISREGELIVETDSGFTRQVGVKELRLLY